MKEKVYEYSPKQVVYLLGAGATQAEVDYQGGEKVNLLMRDLNGLGEGICSRIIKKAKKYKELKIKLGDKNEIDIEKLVSLLANTGIEKYKEVAAEFRRLYYQVILESLAKVEVLEKPELAMGLLDMHRNKHFNEKVEKLSGIISLNHDNLFQVASKKIFGGINLGVEFDSTSFKLEEKAPLVIKLYGSFNWKKALPIRVLELKLPSKTKEDTSKSQEDILWIPPSILKESKDYPYNKLMGLAYEMLASKCDILRIIGCSLSQNDWNVISLLFNAQYNQHLCRGNCFKIELIMNQKNGERIKKDCSYFQNIVPIGYLTDGDFDVYKTYEDGNLPKGSELNNPFKYWLKTKVQYHKYRGEIDIDSIDEALKKIMEG